MGREEPLRPESVVLLYRTQNVSMGHLVPLNRTCHLVLPGPFYVEDLPDQSVCGVDLVVIRLEDCRPSAAQQGCPR